MFLLFWFLHFSPFESWKLQLNLLRIGSKRFQILLMLVIFISNWTRSTVCGFCNTLSKKEQQHFFFVCKELEQRNAKCKEDRHYYEIEMLLIHKRAVSLLKGERGEGGGCIYFHYSQGNIQQQRLISLVHSYRNFFNHKEAL